MSVTERVNPYGVNTVDLYFSDEETKAQREEST